MLQQENRLAQILMPSGKITAETLNSVMNEGVIQPYETCQKLIDQGFISEEELLKILKKANFSSSLTDSLEIELNYL